MFLESWNCEMQQNFSNRVLYKISYKTRVEVSLYDREFTHSLRSFANLPSHVNTHFRPLVCNILFHNTCLIDNFLTKPIFLIHWLRVSSFSHLCANLKFLHWSAKLNFAHYCWKFLWLKCVKLKINVLWKLCKKILFLQASKTSNFFLTFQTCIVKNSLCFRQKL